MLRVFARFMALSQAWVCHSRDAGKDLCTAQCTTLSLCILHFLNLPRHARPAGLPTHDQDFPGQKQDQVSVARRRARECRADAARGRLHAGRAAARRAGGRGAAPQDCRRALHRHTLAHAADGRGAGAGAQARRHWLLLHRHQPGGSGRGARARHCGVQRAVFQHPIGGRAGAGRGHFAAARRAREERRGAPRWLAQERRQRLRGARQDAGHRRLRCHWLAAVGAGREPGHAGHLPRRGQQAAAGQRTPGRQSE